MEKYCQNKTHTPNAHNPPHPMHAILHTQHIGKSPSHQGMVPRPKGTWMLKQITQVLWIHGWDSKSLWFKIHHHTLLSGIHNCNKTIMLKTSHQKQVWLIRRYTWE